MANKVHSGPAELQNPLMVHGLASETTLPGSIVAKSGDNLAKATAATTGRLLFAKENGPGQGGHIDDEFASGDEMSAYIGRQGLYFRARLGTGLALTQGETLLERAASGRLAILDTGEAVAVARETVTTQADDELVLVEVL